MSAAGSKGHQCKQNRDSVSVRHRDNTADGFRGLKDGGGRSRGNAPAEYIKSVKYKILRQRAEDFIVSRGCSSILHTDICDRIKVKFKVWI